MSKPMSSDDRAPSRRRQQREAEEPEYEVIDEPEKSERPRRKGSPPLFQDEVVTVTRTRMIIRDASGQNVTYAMANVTSVQMFVEPRNPAVVILGMCSVVMGSLIMSLSRTWGIGLCIVGAGIALIYLLVLKPKYWVQVGTAGAEKNAVYSLDPSWTTEVVAAVNEAIISRG